MTKPIALTDPWLRGLEALVIAHKAKHAFVRTSQETHANPATPWTFAINGRVAHSLERFGLAEGKLVDVHGRIHEPTGDIHADLPLLNFCTTKYRITPKGRDVLRRAKKAKPLRC